MTRLFLVSSSTKNYVEDIDLMIWQAISQGSTCLPYSSLLLLIYPVPALTLRVAWRLAAGFVLKERATQGKSEAAETKLKSKSKQSQNSEAVVARRATSNNEAAPQA